MTASTRQRHQQCVQHHPLLPAKGCLVHKRVHSSRSSKQLQLPQDVATATSTTIHMIDHYTQLSNDQAAQLWYTADDLAVIKDDNEVLAADMEAQYNGECHSTKIGCIDQGAPPGTTWRGLEWIAEHGQWQRYQHRRNCSNHVLDELDRQRHQKGGDPYAPKLKRSSTVTNWDHDALARVCREQTKETRQEAATRGQHDWSQVQDEYDAFMKKSPVRVPPVRAPSLDGSEVTAPLTDAGSSDDDDADDRQRFIDHDDDETVPKATTKTAIRRTSSKSRPKRTKSVEKTVVNVVMIRNNAPRKAITRSSTFSSPSTAKSAMSVHTTTQPKTKTTKTTTTSATARARVGRCSTAKAMLAGTNVQSAATTPKPRSPVKRSSTGTSMNMPRVTRTPIQRSSTAKAMTSPFHKAEQQATKASNKTKLSPIRRSSTAKAMAAKNVPRSSFVMKRSEALTPASFEAAQTIATARRNSFSKPAPLLSDPEAQLSDSDEEEEQPSSKLATMRGAARASPHFHSLVASKPQPGLIRSRTDDLIAKKKKQQQRLGVAR